MPCLRCLIYALTQAGGGDLFFRFASLVQSCCGEGGALQTDIAAVCGEHLPCSGHTGFALYRGVCAFPSTLLRLPAALYEAGPALSVVPVFGCSTKAQIRLRLRFVPSPASAAQAARGLGALSPEAVPLFPPRPQRAPPVGCLWLASVQRSWPLAATLPVADSQEFFR